MQVARLIVTPERECFFGPVDLFQVSHHGLFQSNHPTLVQTIAPTMAIMNNGSRKESLPQTVALLRSTGLRPHQPIRAGGREME